MANNPLANAISFTAPISQGGFQVLAEPAAQQPPLSTDSRLNHSPGAIGSDSKIHNISDVNSYEHMKQQLQNFRFRSHEYQESRKSICLNIGG